ncbi:MAG: hypothetical protein ACAI37_03570 [Chthoniobacter sp.]
MPRVYLVDQRHANSQLAVQSVPPGDLGLLINPFLSVSEVVGQVLDAIIPPQGRKQSVRHSRQNEPESFLISELRILAYSSGDELLLGWGIHPRNAAQLAPLAPHMRTGASGRCLLLGCNVAVGPRRTERYLGGAAVGQRFGMPFNGWEPEELGLSQAPGYALLHAFARTLGVPTTAAIESQTAAIDWSFTGPTLTVGPFGQTTFAGMDMPASVDL